MVSRVILVAAAAALLLLSGTGCFGPINDRLYVSEWKGKRMAPKVLHKDWAYSGERYEQFVWSEER